MAILVLLAFIWLVPRIQVRKLTGLDPDKKAELENEYRKTLTQIVTGFGLVFSLLFTWMQLSQARDLAQQQLALSRRDHVARQLTTALAQFGDSVHPGIRIAGIFGLEQVALRSEDDRVSVLRMLTAFIRDVRQLPTDRGAVQIHTFDCQDTLPLPTDVQATLDAIGRVSLRIEDPRHRFNRINLMNSDLRNAVLDSAKLQYATISGSLLVNAYLTEGTDLYRADLRNTHLEKAWLGSARRARFDHAAMCGAHLEDARLDSAQFRLVNFGDASLGGAVLADANLDGADLSAVQGLDSAQIASAQITNRTKLPPEWEPKFRARSATQLQPTDTTTRCICQ